MKGSKFGVIIKKMFLLLVTTVEQRKTYDSP